MATSLDRGMESQSGPEKLRPAEVTPFDPQAHERSSGDAKLVEALRKGDEQAFASLVRRHYTSMLNVTMNYVASRAVAEEVVQEAWLGVLNGLDQFEARSSLKAWIFSILINRAKTCMKREGRTLPFSSMRDRGDDPAAPSVDPARLSVFAGGGAGWYNSGDQSSNPSGALVRKVGRRMRPPSPHGARRDVCE